MQIVDAQVHIWAESTPQRPWPNRHKPHRETPLDRHALRNAMAEAGVDRAILVPPSWEGEYTDLVTEAVQANPQQFSAMGVVSIAEAVPTIERWSTACGLAGLRFALHRPGLLEALTDGRMDAVWAAAEERQVPLMVLLPHDLLHVLESAARRHPRLKIVLDHLGLVGCAVNEVQVRFKQVLRLGALENIALKASGLPAYSEGPYPFADAHRLVRDALDAFGERRVFWGTDMTRLPCTYREAVTMVTEEMQWMEPSAMRWFMGRGITEWLGLPP